MRGMLLLAMLFFAVLGCSGSRPELEEFASEYVKSVYDGTELYKRYTPEANREVVEISRSNMSKGFEVTGWDYAGPGNYQFAVKFSNGATGVVAVYEQAGEVTAASVIVRPGPKE